MSDYIAPVEDMLFTLRHLAGLETITQLPGLEESTPDVVDAVLREAGRFAGEALAPLNRTGDTSGCRVEDGAVRTPPGFAEAYRGFAEGGWPALPFDAAIGGQGLPEVVATAVNEIWQSANMAFALCPMLTEGAVVAMETHASEALKQRYLPPLVSGEWTCTMELTEPQAGSDLGAVKTRAEPDGDHYRLSGQKIFITWGDHDFTDNIMHLVLARLPDGPEGVKGLSLFLVPKYLLNDDGSRGERNDVYPVSVEHKLGIHGSPTCVMSYGANGGAVGYLVGPPHSGIQCMFTMMNHARVAVGIQGLSISERAYQQAVAYARDRVQGQVPGAQGRAAIIGHADVRRMLMLMKSGIEAMRALCYSIAGSMDHMRRDPDAAARDRHTGRFALLTPVVKGWCTETAQELVSLAVQVHGGMGYIEETGAAQHFRDARIATIYEGTTGIQANDLVGRKILRDNGKALGVLLEDINATARTLSGSNDDHLKFIGGRIAASASALQQAADWLLENYRGDPHVPGAVAVNVMMLTGTVCGGWMMGRAALPAAQGGGAVPSDKPVTARFYAEHYLPRAGSYLAAITAGSGSIMALDADRF